MRASRARAREDALKAALADPDCIMVNRNAGAGTRMLIDQLARRRAAARLRQPAALAQRGRGGGRAGPRRLGRRDRSPVAAMYGLGFLPLAPENYDFLLVESAARAAGGAAFLEGAAPIRRCATHIAALGMVPA